MEGCRQCARHGHALLLTTGELRGIVPDAMRHAHALQRLITRALPLRGRHLLAIRERQFDILIHRQIANQVEALEDESDLLIADARRSAEIKILDRPFPFSV